LILLHNDPKIKSPSVHNKLLGEKIKHPLSTKFDDDFPTPVSKRLKRLDSFHGAEISEDDDAISRAHSLPSPRRTKIPDSGDDDDDGGVALASSQISLESALPAVKTDEEAIAEYEAYEAGEQTLQERLGKSTWGKGRRLQLYNVQRLNAEEGNCSDRSTNIPVGQQKSACR
jgi:fanconi-associated nuclease 1